MTRAAVAQAAAHVADEGGFAALTATAVAKRLGIRTPSLYAHVRDLEALRDAVTGIGFAELVDDISAALAGRSGREALAAFAGAQRDYAHRHPGRWQAMQRAPRADQAGPAGAERLVELTLALLRGYDVPEPEQVHAVRLIGSTVNGFVALEQSGAFSHRPPSAASSWDRIVRSLDHLLTTWPHDPEDAP